MRKHVGTVWTFVVGALLAAVTCGRAYSEPIPDFTKGHKPGNGIRISTYHLRRWGERR